MDHGRDIWNSEEQFLAEAIAKHTNLITSLDKTFYFIIGSMRKGSFRQAVSLPSSRGL